MELPLLRKKATISLEMIDFQSDDFGADMEMIFTEIQRKVVDNVYQDGDMVEESKEANDLIKLIFNRFGLKVKLICDSAPAAMLAFFTNKHHVLLKDYLRGDFKIKDQEKILKHANGKKGKVNLTNATVSGMFSDYENILGLNFHILFKTFKLSIPEAVAITLHEIGHAFSKCEISDRLETTNQVIQNVAQEITGKKDKADKVYIYREMKTVNSKVTEEEIEKLVDGNRLMSSYTWFKMVVGSVEEQTLNNVYSATSSEQVADGFATRFKYGRQLILALDKMHVYGGDSSKKRNQPLPEMLIDEIIFTIHALAAIAAYTIFFPVSIICGLLAFACLRRNGEDFKDYTYDELKIRYKRIRNEYVAFLKDTNVPLEYTKNTLEDIYVMDRIIDETYRHSNLLSKIANFIFTDAREAKASIAEQQLHEELIHSDLYVMAASLRTIDK